MYTYVYLFTYVNMAYTLALNVYI